MTDVRPALVLYTFYQF